MRTRIVFHMTDVATAVVDATAAGRRRSASFHRRAATVAAATTPSKAKGLLVGLDRPNMQIGEEEREGRLEGGGF